MARRRYQPRPHSGRTGCSGCGVTKSVTWHRPEGSDLPLCGECWPLYVKSGGLNALLLNDEIADGFRNRLAARALGVSERSGLASVYQFRTFSEAVSQPHAGFREPFQYVPADVLDLARYGESPEGRRAADRAARARAAVAAKPTTPALPAMTLPGTTT